MNEYVHQYPILQHSVSLEVCWVSVEALMTGPRLNLKLCRSPYQDYSFILIQVVSSGIRE